MSAILYKSRKDCQTLLIKTIFVCFLRDSANKGRDMKLNLALFIICMGSSLKENNLLVEMFFFPLRIDLYWEAKQKRHCFFPESIHIQFK